MTYSKLELFSNYVTNPQHVDINWETLISMKINQHISATITGQLLYDYDIDIPFDTNDDGVVDELGPKIQFKEVLGLGLSYVF